MQAQAKKFAYQSLIDGQLVVSMAREVAHDCIIESKKNKELVQEIVLDIASNVVTESELSREKKEQEKVKESLANEACDKLLSLIIGENLGLMA